MKLCRLAVRPGGAHPPGAVYGLVGGGGEHQQLVPLVGQQARVDLHGDLVVEGQAAGPLDQLVVDPVPDAAELVRQVGGAVVQQVVHVLQSQNVRTGTATLAKCFGIFKQKQFYCTQSY